MENEYSDYRKTKSTRAISIRIADFLEQYDPQKYDPMNRAQTVTEINDILQRRSDRTIESLMDEVEEKLGEDGANIGAEIVTDVKDFIRQQLTLGAPYHGKGVKHYKFKIYDPDAERPLKIINQQKYDGAAKVGFPLDFFRESYFDNVTFYCLPDHADFNFSRFNDCNFAVCRIREATFDGTSIYGTDFHSCMVQYATFFNATLANTRFLDCGMENVSFQRARLKSCSALDSTMLSVGFMNAKLDGCSFDRVKAFGIRDLHTAMSTQGGATEKEVEQNRKAIFTALRPESHGQFTPLQKKRGQR